MLSRIIAIQDNVPKSIIGFVGDGYSMEPKIVARERNTNSFIVSFTDSISMTHFN